MIKSILSFIVRKLWLVLAILLVLAAVLLSVLRYSLPYLDNYRVEIEELITGYYGQEISIGALDADWSAFGPSLVLEDVELELDQDYPLQVRAARTYLVLNLWQTLLNRQWQLEDFVLEGVELDYRYERDGGAPPDAPLIAAAENLLLEQLENFQVVNSRLRILDQNDQARELFIEQLSWVNEDNRRQGTGRFRVSDITANHLNFVVDVSGDNFAQMQGQLYVNASQLDLSPWLEKIIAGIDITRAELNLTGWLDFANGQLGNGQLHFGENRLHWQRNGTEHELRSSPVIWGLWPQDEGWLLNSETLTFQVDGKPWPVESVVWDYQSGTHLWNFHNLEIRDVGPLWSFFGSPGQQIQDWFAGIQPGGLVNQVEVRLDSDLDWGFHVQAQDINWQAYRGIPGFDGLNFALWSNLEQGAFWLRGDQVSLNSPMTFTDQQKLSSLDWSGYWNRYNDGWSVALPSGKLELPSARLEQEALITHTAATGTELEWVLSGEGQQLQVSEALELLPLQLGDRLTEYLRGSITSGEVQNLAMLWRGELANFPYQYNDGVFQAQVFAAPLNFRFQPEWPTIENTELELEFREGGLQMQAQGGDLMGAEVVSVSAGIPELLLPEPWLIIDAQARGSGPQAREVFANSPLADSVGAALEQVQTASVVDGDFRLRIPLFKPSEGDTENRVTVQGGVDFSGETVTIKPVNLDVNDVQGRFTFTENAIGGEDMTASVFGLPVQIQLKGETRNGGYRVQSNIDGAWNVETLPQQVPGAWLKPYLTGDITSSAQFVLDLNGSDGYSFNWTMGTELDETGIELPSPFAKPRGEALQWTTRVYGDDSEIQIRSDIPERLRVAAALATGSRDLDWLSLVIGDQRDLIRTRGSGFSIHADVARIDVRDWLPLLEMTGQPGEGEQALFNLPSLQRVQASADELVWLGHTFDDLSLEGSAIDDGFSLQLNADQGRMRVTLPDDTSPLAIEADFLNLEKSEADADASGTTAGRVDTGDNVLERLPPLRFVCHVCRYRGSELGRIELELDPTQGGEQLQVLNVSRTGAELNMQGGWQGSAETRRTQLSGWLATTDVGKLLSDFGANSVVRDSNAQVEFDLGWHGAPQDFELATLGGVVDWRLGSGYLRDVSDGGARLFSLFSLESLMRKLTLDFRDIFARGMFYSSFSGTLNLEDGRVYTDNTRMNGSAGDMEVEGSTDLVSERLDYNLVYVPKVTSSLPVLVAWMVNPPTGLAALLLDRVLHDAQVISRLEYRITGTVSEPQVDEVARDQREVQIPDVDLDEELEEELNNGTN
ncbi:YhdP family protein [Aliidiomarina sp. Khilg15.8]